MKIILDSSAIGKGMSEVNKIFISKYIKYTIPRIKLSIIIVNEREA